MQRKDIFFRKPILAKPARIIKYKRLTTKRRVFDRTDVKRVRDYLNKFILGRDSHSKDMLSKSLLEITKRIVKKQNQYAMAKGSSKSFDIASNEARSFIVSLLSEKKIDSIIIKSVFDHKVFDINEIIDLYSKANLIPKAKLPLAKRTARMRTAILYLKIERILEAVDLAGKKDKLVLHYFRNAIAPIYGVIAPV